MIPITEELRNDDQRPGPKRTPELRGPAPAATGARSLFPRDAFRKGDFDGTIALES